MVRERRIGPVAMTKGLVSRPLPFASGALFSAFNVEAGDGMLATRMGHEVLGQRTPSPNAWDVDAAVYPATWTTTIGYLKLDIDNTAGGTPAGVTSPGDIMIAYFSLQSGTGIELPLLTWEYYADDATWKTLHVDKDYLESAGVLVWPVASAETWIRFIVPADWSPADPLALGGAHGQYAWIRVTSTSGSFSTMVIDPSGTGAIVASRACVPLALPSFRSRRTWETFVITSAPEEGYVNVSWYDGSPGKLDNIQVTQFNDVASAESCVVAYLTSTDQMLIGVDGEWVKISWDGTAWVSSGTFTPDSGAATANTAWEDVPCIGALPAASCVAVYNGRLFVAEVGTGRVRWGAPEEYWAIFPEANVYSLQSRGAGDVVGMYSLHGQLFLFTAGEIWMASEGDPVPGQDSLVSFSLVEEVGAIAKGSIVATEEAIYFLSGDGVRRFNGQDSRVISSAVTDLFRDSSESPWAVRNKSTAVGVVHDIERQYRLSYKTSGATMHNAMLTIDIDEGSCWIWGSEQLTDIDTTVEGQERWGIRASLLTYRPDMGKVLMVSADSWLSAMDTGYQDAGQQIDWSFESQLVGIGEPGRRRLTRAVIDAEREHVSSITVGVVVDGRRVDSRTLGQQRDGAPSDAALGAADAAGEALLEDYGSHAPFVLRTRAVGRNHRIKVAALAPDYGRISVAAITVDIQDA